MKELCDRNFCGYVSLAFANVFCVICFCIEHLLLLDKCYHNHISFSFIFVVSWHSYGMKWASMNNPIYKFVLKENKVKLMTACCTTAIQKPIRL
jgi:hypothetical protein